MGGRALRGTYRAKLYGRCRDAGKPLPFDHARAFRLYEALFGQAEYLIKGNQLLIVPSGALTQLPFQVLVTAPPAGGEINRRLAYPRSRAHCAARGSSLKALRRVARPSAATKPMIGFGNPLLDGDRIIRSSAPTSRSSRSAPGQTALPRDGLERVAALVGLRRGVTPVQTRGGLADVEFLRSKRRCPRQRTNSAPWRATCTPIRRDPAWRACYRARGEALERNGPACAIPHRAFRDAWRAGGPGLRAIASLASFYTARGAQRRGRWLPHRVRDRGPEARCGLGDPSACNPAAGAAQGAEALSGLARAFIYAQARALLVSHWEVNPSPR